MGSGSSRTQSDLKIKENAIDNNNRGIHIVRNRYATIEGNTITNSAWQGIQLQGTQSSLVTGNTIVQNSTGILMHYVEADSVIGHATTNTVYENIFHNTVNASFTVYSDSVGMSTGVNYYDHQGRGNTWQDYTGSDQNLDGIGDSTYWINQQWNKGDHYPLVAVSVAFSPDPPKPRLGEYYKTNLTLINNLSRDLAFNGISLKCTRPYNSHLQNGCSGARFDTWLIEADATPLWGPRPLNHTLYSNREGTYAFPYVPYWNWIPSPHEPISGVYTTGYTNMWYRLGSFIPVAGVFIDFYDKSLILSNALDEITFVFEAESGSDPFLSFLVDIEMGIPEDKYDHLGYSFIFSGECRVLVTLGVGFLMVSWTGAGALMAASCFALAAMAYIESVDSYFAAWDPTIEIRREISLEPVLLPEVRTMEEGDAKEMAQKMCDHLAAVIAAKEAYIRYYGALGAAQPEYARQRLDEAIRHTRAAQDRLSSLKRSFREISGDFPILSDEELDAVADHIEKNGLPSVVEDVIGRLGGDVAQARELIKDGVVEMARDRKAFVKDPANCDGELMIFLEICTDCNDNGVGDSEDIASGASADCNRNGVPDECDVSKGSSSDCNGNNVPDECEGLGELQYRYEVADAAAEYDPRDGAAALETPLIFHDAPCGPGRVTGFVMVLAHDPALLQATRLLPGEAVDPDFVVADIYPGGITYEVTLPVTDFDDGLFAGGPREVGRVHYETKAEALRGNAAGARLELRWENSFLPPGGAPLQNAVRTVDGVLIPITTAGVVELQPRSGASGQRPGDCNQDTMLDISDAVCLVGFLFLGQPQALPCDGGTARDEGNRELLDANGDGFLDLTDAVSVLSYLFVGGSPHALGTECVPVDGCPSNCE